MNTKVDELAIKIVSFTPEQVAKIQSPPLSDQVIRVIRNSGKDFLQQFVERGNEEFTRSLIQGYWNRDGCRN